MLGVGELNGEQKTTEKRAHFIHCLSFGRVSFVYFAITTASFSAIIYRFNLVTRSVFRGFVWCLLKVPISVMFFL